MNKNNKRLTTLPLIFIPSLEFYWKLAQCHICVFTDHLQYTKRSPVSISPPLVGEGDRLRLPVRHDGRPRAIYQKRIDLSSAPLNRHLKTLRHLYHDFAYGYYYLPHIEELQKSKYNSLRDYLLVWHKMIIQWLHLPVEIFAASDLNPEKKTDSFILSLCRRFKMPGYINDEVVFEKKWVEPETLQKEGIQIENFQPFPAAHIFQNHRRRSVLTFLMKFGPEAGFLIKQFGAG